MTRARAEPIFVTDAHRGGEKRFVVRADEKADLRFLELEAAIRVSRQIGLTSGRDFLQTKRR
jgi:hypothetical protein